MTIKYILPDGQTLSAGVAFQLEVELAPGTSDTLSFPPNWLELATPSDLIRLGITTTHVDAPPSPVAPPTVYDVVEERTRRLALGFDYDFNDERGVHHIGTTFEDMLGWDEVSKSAQAEINLGNPYGIFTVIVTNTGAAQITAMEWQHILRSAKDARQPIWAASFALQAMNPIPSDYASDAYW